MHIFVPQDCKCTKMASIQVSLILKNSQKFLHLNAKKAELRSALDAEMTDIPLETKRRYFVLANCNYEITKKANLVGKYCHIGKRPMESQNQGTSS